MGKDANGCYIIDEVLTDCIVVVENVVVYGILTAMPKKTAAGCIEQSAACLICDV